MKKRLLLCALLCAVRAQANPQILTVDVQPTLRLLLYQEDTDHDGVITVKDHGPKRFLISSPGQASYEVAGLMPLANLLEELTRAQNLKQLDVQLSSTTLYAPMPERLGQLIQRDYWPALIRQLDEKGLQKLLFDEKVSSTAPHYLYVPADDAHALSYYQKILEHHPDWNVHLVPLARGTTVANDAPGILSLAFDADGNPLPFVVPGGRFNELYGWDSYFILLGLLHDGRRDLAQDLVTHFIYEIHHYGKILNANRSYYLTRSQPPFLTAMVLAIYNSGPRDAAARRQLAQGLDAAMLEYETVWSTGPHQTATGLARYFDSGHGAPPETEAGAFDYVYAPYAQKAGMSVDAYAKAYSSGVVRNADLDAYFVNDRAMRESGHDTSVRLRGVAAELNPVDLNALLYRYERDIADTLHQEFSNRLICSDGRIETSAIWAARAKERQRLMNAYLWDGSRGLYADYNFKTHSRQAYIGATTFYPLWAGAASPAQARSLVHNALPLLESAGGLLAGTEKSRGDVTPQAPQGQWDYPFGWAPHQMMLWQGLERYGYGEDARRMAYRWLYTIVLCASESNGLIVEKYDVINRSGFRTAEYGNVGLGFHGISDGGFGWTNASLESGLGLLNTEQHAALDALIPPEWVSSTAQDADNATQTANFTGDAGKSVATNHWKNTADVSYVDTTGNSRGQTTSVRDLLVYTHEPYQLGILAQGLGAESAGVPSTEQYQSNEKLDYTLNTREYLFEKVGWAKDRFAGILGHYEGIGGIGQHWINTPKHKWDGEAGAGYVDENRSDEAADKFEAIRGFTAYTYHVTSTSYFTQTVEWLFNAIDGPDFRVHTDTSITAAISKHLALKLDYSVQHINRPPPHTVSDDTITSVSLSSTY